jgi:hypothetical protein
MIICLLSKNGRFKPLNTVFFSASFTNCRDIVILLLEMKKLYLHLESKHRSNLSGGSDPSGAAGSSSIAPDQAQPTYGTAVVSQPLETTAGPAVTTQGHSSSSLPQGPQTRSVLMMAANAATAVAAPAIASHGSQKGGGRC